MSGFRGKSWTKQESCERAGPVDTRFEKLWSMTINADTKSDSAASNAADALEMANNLSEMVKKEVKLIDPQPIVQQVLKHLEQHPHVTPSPLAFEALTHTLRLRSVLLEPKFGKNNINTQIRLERKSMESVRAQMEAENGDLAKQFAALFGDLDVPKGQSTDELRKACIKRLKESLEVDQKIPTGLKGNA